MKTAAQTRPATCGPDAVALEDADPGWREIALTLDPVTGERPLWPTEPIAKVVIEGNRAVPTSLLLAAIESQPGAAVQADVVTADIRRLWQLEVLADVQVRLEQRPAGSALVYRVAERPLIGAVTVIVNGANIPAQSTDRRWRRIHLLAGSVYDPWRVRRAADRAQTRYHDDGYMRAAVTAVIKRGTTGAATVKNADAASSPAPVHVCFRADRGRKYKLEDIAFNGNKGLTSSQLRARLQTAEGKVNTGGGRYRPDWLTRDLAHVQALYYEHGYLNVTLSPPALELDDERGVARVSIAVREGRQFRYGSIAISGSPAARPASYRALFAGRTGDVFVRSQVMAWIEELERRERAAGRVRPVVTPLTDIDGERAVVDLRVDIGGE